MLSPGLVPSVVVTGRWSRWTRRGRNIDDQLDVNDLKCAMSGTTDDPFLPSLVDGVLELAERAEAVIRGG
jgi:hypothetical protein